MWTRAGIPDPPYDVRLIGCGTGSADVGWNAGSDNNDPITEYIVYYNTSQVPPGIFQV